MLSRQLAITSSEPVDRPVVTVAASSAAEMATVEAMVLDGMAQTQRRRRRGSRGHAKGLTVVGNTSDLGR